MTTEQLAKKVIRMLDAQQAYFKAAREGVASAERNRLLKVSKAMEQELRGMAEDALKPNSQTSLF